MRYFYVIVFLISAVSGIAQIPFDRQSVLDFQHDLNADFKNTDKSPLPKNDLAGFSGLDFFAADSTFFVNAKFIRTPDAKPFEMQTTTNRLPVYVVYGTLHFELHGTPCKLNVYQNVAFADKPGFEDSLFLPFSDLTNGNETYIGGRYIDVKIPNGNTMAIDFNKAYNPYCAYNPRYSCPKIPLENDLQVEVKAGVKKYHD